MKLETIIKITTIVGGALTGLAGLGSAAYEANKLVKEGGKKKAEESKNDSQENS